MNGERRHLEENVARLIGASLGESARLDARAGDETRNRLLARLRAEHQPAAFPDGILLLLAGVLGFVAARLAIEFLQAGPTAMMSTPLLVGTLALALNLVCVPITGILIVRSRRYA